MKLTKSKLQQIIKEEIEKISEMERYDPVDIMADENVVDKPSDVANKYPKHYEFLQSVMQKGDVGSNRSEKYMRLLFWLMNGSIKDLEEIGENDARQLIDAASDESGKARAERSRAWEKENPDTRTPEERQAASDQSMAASYEADPNRFTRGT